MSTFRLNSRRYVGGRGTDAQAETGNSSHALAVLPGGGRSRNVTLDDLGGKDGKVCDTSPNALNAASQFFAESANRSAPGSLRRSGRQGANFILY